MSGERGGASLEKDVTGEAYVELYQDRPLPNEAEGVRKNDHGWGGRQPGRGRMPRHTDRAIVVRKPARSLVPGRALSVRYLMRRGSRAENRLGEDVLRMNVTEGQNELQRQGKQPEPRSCASLQSQPPHHGSFGSRTRARHADAGSDPENYDNRAELSAIRRGPRRGVRERRGARWSCGGVPRAG